MKPIEKKCFLCPQNKFGKCLFICLCRNFKDVHSTVLSTFHATIYLAISSGIAKKSPKYDDFKFPQLDLYIVHKYLNL